MLKLAEVEPPAPATNEILIKIHAVEATKADCEMRSFRFAVKWFWLPLRLAFGIRKPRNKILGAYFAGEVESVPQTCSRLKVGDKVFGASKLKLGAYGEYLSLPDNYAIEKMPANMSFEEAAASLLGGWNALHFIDKVKLKAGESILINGAGGSIGLFAIQIAKSIGAKVTAVDKASKHDVLKTAGANRIIDYQEQSFADSDERYDVVFDMVASSSYSSCISVLNPKGRYAKGNPRLLDLLRSLVTPRLSGKEVVVAFAGETIQELATLKEMIEAGKIRSIIDSTFSMEQAAAAHRKVETEKRNGAIVISIP